MRRIEQARQMGSLLDFLDSSGLTTDDQREVLLEAASMFVDDAEDEDDEEDIRSDEGTLDDAEVIPEDARYRDAWDWLTANKCDVDLTAEGLWTVYGPDGVNFRHKGDTPFSAVRQAMVEVRDNADRVERARKIVDEAMDEHVARRVGAALVANPLTRPHRIGIPPGTSLQDHLAIAKAQRDASEAQRMMLVTRGEQAMVEAFRESRGK